MNEFGGFDLNSLGLDSSYAPHLQQQNRHQQHHQHQHQHGYVPTHGNINVINTNTNGPCMESYDPSQVLMPPMHTSPYNSIAAVGGQHPSSSNNSSGSNKNGVVRNNHNRHRQSHTHTQHTHQILMPPSQSNSHHHHQQHNITHSQQPQQQLQPQPQIHQQRLHRGLPDLEPLPIPKNGDRISSGRGGVQQLPQYSSHSSSTLSYDLPDLEPYRISDRNNGTTEKSSTVTSCFSMSPDPSSQQNIQYKQQKIPRQQPSAKPKPIAEEWLESLQIKVSGVALEPMSGSEIIKLLKQRSNEVLTRYLPCVDFLVQCQQELRKGLQVATTKRYTNHRFRNALTPRQFHTQYISQLPERFYRKNKRIMTIENLSTAYKQLETLVSNASVAESQGCEAVKNTFLGGMKDGESWGLRKWLSKQGGALHICNDTECLSTSCQKLDRELESTRKLADHLRPLAAAALKKLKSEIPSSYQEQSSAHPYLPFFHRLECALRGMANFDPEDDDVICIIDDDEVEELKAKATSAPPASSKRKRSRNKISGSSDDNSKAKGASGSSSKSAKRKVVKQFESTFDEDNDSDIEVLERKPPPKRSDNKKSTTNRNVLDANVNINHYASEGTADAEDDSDIMQELLKTLDDDTNEDPINFDDFEEKSDIDEVDVNGGNHKSNISKFDAAYLADGLDSLASLFDSNQQDTVRPDDITKGSFWDDRYQYARALRLFAEILQAPDCTNMFVDSVDEDELIQEGKLPYNEIIKHPLCFRDIVSALLQDFNRFDNTIECSDGILPRVTTLQEWNMWKGRELLQAIDLVFLNSLAYGKANEGIEKTRVRSCTNKLRKMLWAGIKEVIDDSLSSCDIEERRRHTPTRRGESSGFVVKKGSP